MIAAQPSWSRDSRRTPSHHAGVTFVRCRHARRLRQGSGLRSPPNTFRRIAFDTQRLFGTFADRHPLALRLVGIWSRPGGACTPGGLMPGSASHDWTPLGRPCPGSRSPQRRAGLAHYPKPSLPTCTHFLIDADRVVVFGAASQRRRCRATRAHGPGEVIFDRRPPHSAALPRHGATFSSDRYALIRLAEGSSSTRLPWFAAVFPGRAEAATSSSSACRFHGASWPRRPLISPQ